MTADCDYCKSLISADASIASELVDFLHKIYGDEKLSSSDFLKTFGIKYQLQALLHKSSQRDCFKSSQDKFQKLLQQIQSFCGEYTAFDIQEQVTKEMSEEISKVKEIFPDLGEGFIEACLSYFDRKPENVINSLFEDNLPPELAKLDKNMKSFNKPQTAQEPKPATIDNFYVKKKIQKILQNMKWILKLIK